MTLVRRLRDTVLTWPIRTEALIVVFGAFGYALISTACYLFGVRPGAAITEHHLRFLLIYEPATLVILGGFLYLRGWTFKRVGLTPRFIDTLIGVGLAIGAYAAYVALWILAAAANLQPAYLNGASSLVDGHFALLTVIAVSILNPLFEELFVCGYVITVAKESGYLALGVNASIAIRLAYHLYQGGAGVVGIIPLGLIFAVWYSRTRRLWPVVVAHGLTDFVGLVSFVN
jgi:membrane protease YdiL (CAAX protease family)